MVGLLSSNVNMGNGYLLIFKLPANYFVEVCLKIQINYLASL